MPSSSKDIDVGAAASLSGTVAGGVSEDLRASEPELRERVQRILDEALRQGATAAEVGVSRDLGLAVSVRRGELETVEFTRDQGFGISLYVGQRKGTASTTDAGDQAIRDTVAKALNIARFTAEDPAAGLADPALLATDVPDLGLFHPWPVDVDGALERALACEAAALEHDPRISNSEGATVSSHQTVRAYGNSHGFVGSYCSTRHGAGVSVIARDERGMQRNHWSCVRRDPDDLDSFESVGRRAAERAVAALGAAPVPTTRASVLFDSLVATSLIGHFLGAISGGNLYRRSSFLLDALGEQLFPASINLDERPHLRGGMGSTAFDGDGVATREQAFVEAGCLQRYLLSTYSARRLGLETTANAGGVHNLHVTDSASPDLVLDDMIAGMERGLLVTELMGQGVNLVTGDYSRGAGGFWVERGEIVAPVQEVTIAANLRDVFRGIQAVGSDVAHPGNILCGPILVGEMTIAGT